MLWLAVRKHLNPQKNAGTDRLVRIWKSGLILAGLACFGSLAGAYAAELNARPSLSSVDSTCATIERFEGRVEVLDRTRSTMLDVAPKAAIPCGGWVSVASGWLRVKHRNGYWFHAGPNSLLQIMGEKEPGAVDLVMIKGTFYGQVSGGARSLVMTTANGVVRITSGAALAVFNPELEETQLTALEKSASLENRFVAAHKISVNAGESTSLSLKLLRVVPSVPQVVSMSAVRERLSELQIDEADQRRALAGVKIRQNRKFASILGGGKGGDRIIASENERLKSGKVRALRIPAGLEFSNYGRHSNQWKGGADDHKAENEKLHKVWVKKTLGGAGNVGDKILYPDRFYGRSQRINIEVNAPGSRGLSNVRHSPQADAEKGKLLEELSKIRPE